MKKFTWQEVQKHNKPNDAFVSIHGKVYDVTEWKQNHPGGADVVNYVAGKEITNLFESYHKLDSVKVFGTEKVPCVGELETYRFPIFQPEKETGFYHTVKQRVEEHFKKTGVKDTRQINNFVKANTIFILGGMVLCYYLSSYSFEMSFLKRIFFAFMAGVFHHLSMVHLWHDASHSSYTRNSSVWKYFGILGESLTGHSMYIWIHRHVFAHHIWTNVAGVDPDIAIYKCSPKKPIEHYRVNQFVMPSALQPIIYPFVTFQMKIDDVISFHRGQMENVVINDTGILQTIRFYFGKFVYYFHRVFLPIYLGHSIFKIMLLQTITEATSGVFFGILSQISHVSENCEWPSEKPIPKDWGECQVLTTTDYEHESPFWTYLSGFLNYQVPHHLFPSVAPHFYPEILPIIKRTCEEYNVPYDCEDTFYQTLQKHFSHLKQFQSLREDYYKRIFDDKKKLNTMLEKFDFFIHNTFGSK